MHEIQEFYINGEQDVEFTIEVIQGQHVFVGVVKKGAYEWQ